MNKYAIWFLFSVFSLTICAQKNFYRIDGKTAPRYNGSLVTLFTFTGNYIRSVDSAYVANGHFSFVGPEYLYEKSLISMGNYPDSVFAAELYLEQGPIEVELKQKSVVHSPLVTEYKLYVDSCSSIERAYSVEGQTQAFYNEGTERLLSYKYQFKKKHIHNGIGRNLLIEESAQYESDPYFYKLYELLPEKDKKRYEVQDSYKERVRKDKQIQLENKPFPDLTLINTSGKEQRISDYVGKSKLLFLDFWASWCGPCIAQQPYIKELYEKYKADGFEVLGISLDTNAKSWLAAIERTGNPWPELCAGSKEREDLIRESYCIIGIPYGVLIDQSGKVIKVNCGHWQILEWVLGEYYKK
nr:TlpA disulfide reductase family protein [uncultured Bacteroides sp.]